MKARPAKARATPCTAASQRGGALWKQLVAWPFIFAVALVAPYFDRLLEALDRWLAR